MVIRSSPEDWEKLDQGPVYLERLREVIEDGQRRLEVDSHHCLAVYKPDVSLRLAWGLKLRDEPSLPPWRHKDQTLERRIVDAFWQGALVARWTILDLNSGYCYLPTPWLADLDEVTGRARGHSAKASDVALARLVNLLTRPSIPFDRCLKETGIAEVPDDYKYEE